MARIYHGTSSWSEKTWVGPFYPPGTAAGDFLSHYATQFPSVEADVTYYRVPDERLVRGWDDKTPEGFMLSAKFPRSVVHCGKGPQPDASKLLLHEHVAPDAERFVEMMALLGDKCGPLVLQFPYFNKKAFKEPGPFFERLDAFLQHLPGGHRYAVEIRNRNWLQPEFFELLRGNKAGFVLLDLNYMPHPDQLDPADLLTSGYSYIRLIGDRKAVDERTESFDKIVLDQGPRLQRWAELIQSLWDRAGQIYVYANNHYAGHGPATIRDLIARLDELQDGADQP